MSMGIINQAKTIMYSQHTPRGTCSNIKDWMSRSFRFLILKGQMKYTVLMLSSQYLKGCDSTFKVNVSNSKLLLKIPSAILVHID